MSRSQHGHELSPPLVRFDNEGHRQEYVQDSYDDEQDHSTYSEQDVDLDVVEGFDVSDNADATVNDFQHNPSVSDGGVDKSTQAASIMGTPYFKRPFSGGQDPSAGFKYATAQKVQLDLVGNRKGWASNESEAPQLNPSDALCEVPVVPQVTDADVRNRGASYHKTVALSINVPQGHENAAQPPRRAEGVPLQSDYQGLEAANSHGLDRTWVTSQLGRGKKEELPLESDAQESHNHPDLGKSVKSASEAPHLGDIDPRRPHTDTAQAGSRSHVHDAQKSFSQTTMQSKDNDSYHQTSDGRPVRAIDPRAAQLKVPHKTTKRKNTSKNSAKHHRGSNAGQIVSALQGADGLPNTVNENQSLVVDRKCPDGFAGDIFQAPAESKPWSPVLEVDAPVKSAKVIEDQTEPVLSLRNEASTAMETHPQLALSPLNPTMNPVMQNNEYVERSQEVKMPVQDTAHVANPRLPLKPTPNPNKFANDFNPQSPPADQPHFTDARRLGGEGRNTELHDRPDSYGNSKCVHPAMDRSKYQQFSRAHTPHVGPSNDMHRVSARYGTAKVGKSKRKAAPGPKQVSEVAMPQMAGDFDDSGITDILKIVAWKMAQGQQWKAQASEAALRNLESKIYTLERDNQVVWQDLRRTMQEKDDLLGIIKDRDKVVNTKEQQIKKMERFLNGVSNDVEKCFSQLTNTRQKCEEIEKECTAYRVEREQLEQVATDCREKLVQIQRRLEVVGRDASSEIDRLNQCHIYAETRLAEFTGLLTEERYRSMKLQQALEAASKNHRVLRETKQNQQAILGQLRDLHEAITDSRNEDAAAKEKLDECVKLVQTMQAADTVQPSDVQRLEELLRTMRENVFARLEELRLGGTESMAAQSSIRTCLEERLEAWRADFVTSQSLKDEYAVLRGTNATLTERSATLESSMSQLRQELNDAKVKETSLSEKLVQLETEKAALQHELQSGGVLTLRLQEVEQVNVNLQSELEKAQSELTEETQKLRDLEATEESMRNELQGRQAAANLHAIRADVSKTAQKIKEDATINLENEVQQAKQAKIQLEAKLKAAQDEAESYKPRLDTLTKRDEAKESEIRKLKEEISVKDRTLAGAKRVQDTAAQATKKTYASEVEKLRTDFDAKVAKLQDQKDREIEAMRRQLSSLQAAKDESDRKAENLCKITQTQQNELENLRHHTAGNGELQNELHELERQAHPEAEVTRFGERTRHQAGVQTKTPPDTTDQQPRKPRRTANGHSTHNENIRRPGAGIDHLTAVRAGSQYEESHINEEATFLEAEAELTNVSQLETVDENGISQVALRESVPETQYESLPTRFDDLNQSMRSQFPSSPAPPSSSALSEVPYSPIPPRPPRGVHCSYNPSSDSWILQPVAGNARLSTPQRSLPPKSPPVRSNTASKMSSVKPQNQSQTSSFEASDHHQNPKSQPQHGARSVAVAGHGDNTSRGREAGVDFPLTAANFIMQRQPVGSHKMTKQREPPHPTKKPISRSETQGVVPMSKPASLPLPALKRSRDSTQQTTAETPKRAKHVHHPDSTPRPSREGSRYATPQNGIPKMTTYSAKQSQTTRTPKGTTQSSQSLGSQSLLRSSAPVANAKRSTGKGQPRQRSYSTRYAERRILERISQELD